MNSFKFNVGRDLKHYSSYIPKINKPTLRSILKLCVAFLEQKKYSKEAYDKEYIKIASASEIQAEDYAIMFTAISILLETFLRSKNVHAQDLSEALKELKFSDECVDDLSKVLLSNHQTLFDQMQEMRLLKPIDKLQTRINISLIESGQSPTIILHLEHRGKIQTINLSLKHFHRFRLAISIILSEFHAIEGKKS
ncbi:hypothetical protein ACKWTF_011138 [Chironomus riparius]